ncbi:MAG: tRNA 4-thiouridine(8) synthase ThiI [Lachnospiraceae bacterium]|nr:tRNA 4-thiouridine(8) synthase ThiI [Lachnospiraceae bacterium]
MYRAFLIKYGEIGVKGKNRYLFEDALVKQIEHSLKRVEGEFKVSKESGRIYVNVTSESYDYDDTIKALTSVFGIIGVCPMVQVEDHGFDELAKETIAYMDRAYPDKKLTFKVEARRARKEYPLNSQEINVLMGEKVLMAFEEQGMRVDVHHPDVLLCVEIRNKINIYSQELKGRGGMPVGTNGKAMLLLSGGIDSPVAGFLAAKRGITVEAVYFNSPPYTSERAKQKVVDLAKEISRYCGPVKLHIVNFTEIQLHLYDKVPQDELTIIMKRYFYRVAETIARKEGCIGLVTGESVGQVSSQTLQSLAVINEVATMPVIRPLVCFDKQEIIDISIDIGTYETSILPYEDCCTIFVAKHPVTKPSSEKIAKHEARVAESIVPLLEEALANVEVVVAE